MMDWFDILKRTTGFFTIWNTTDLVREATMEWSESVQPGISYHHWLIRKQVADILLPKLKQMAKEEGLPNPGSKSTHYINRHFNLKDGETSTYDKIMFNALKQSGAWRVTGPYSRAATYVKL